MEKYSLIIQGPIMSVGTSGATYIRHYTDKSDNYVVKYNCVQNIQLILKRYANLFDEIIVSTWEDEVITLHDVSFCNNCRIIKSKDITPVYINELHPNGQIGLLKQFYSMQQGMNELSDKNPENYIVKIRTDQFVDLELLIKEHRLRTQEERQKKIAVSYFGFNSVADFYFVATRKIMEDLSAAVMNIVHIPQINISKTSVHFVIPYAYFIQRAKVDPKHERSIFLKSWFPTFERFNEQIINCTEAGKITMFVKEHFYSLSSELLYLTEWRGDRIDDNPAFLFQLYTDFSERSPKLNALNMFIYLSPETYFVQKGKRDVKAIVGFINFILLSKLPFYKKWTMKKYKVQPTLL